MQAWHTRTAHCLHEEEGLAKHVHLGGCLSGVCLPVYKMYTPLEICNYHFNSNSKCKVQQIIAFT